MLCGLATHRHHFLRVGVPDETWAARRILKDYCTGQLLHCELPEGAEGAKGFQMFPGFAKRAANLPKLQKGSLATFAGTQLLHSTGKTSLENIILSNNKALPDPFQKAT